MTIRKYVHEYTKELSKGTPMRALLLFLSFFFLSPLSAQAAHKDTWKGRIAALKLFRSDIISSIAVLEGDAREMEYRRICKMRPKKSAYLPTCEYKDWTGEDNRSVPSKAGEFFEIRCRNKYKEPLSCTVSGWSKGFVAGHPSNSATDPTGAVEDFRPSLFVIPLQVCIGEVDGAVFVCLESVL